MGNSVSTIQRNESRACYGVFGLMEFMLRIKTPAGGIDVHFAGGQLSGYGVMPATFRTSDPVMKRLIEQTPEYVAGKIRKISSQ